MPYFRRDEHNANLARAREERTELAALTARVDAAQTKLDAEYQPVATRARELQGMYDLPWQTAFNRAYSEQRALARQA